MKRYILTLSAASALVLAGVVSAGEQLTSAQMDGITAGGAGADTTTSAAWGNVVSASTNTNTLTQALQAYFPEFGWVAQLQTNSSSTGNAAASSGTVLPADPADGNGDGFTQLSLSGATANGQAVGILWANSNGATTTEANVIWNNPNSTLANPYAWGTANNTAQAASGLVGVPASVSSYSTSSSVLQNY
jgi:hypothetical protein